MLQFDKEIIQADIGHDLLVTFTKDAQQIS